MALAPGIVASRGNAAVVEVVCRRPLRPKFWMQLPHHLRTHILEGILQLIPCHGDAIFCDDGRPKFLLALPRCAPWGRA